MRSARIRPALQVVAVLAAVLSLPSGPAIADPRADAGALRRAVFDTVWTRVRDRHYDPKMNGVDWNAVRRRYWPRARRSEGRAFYAVLNEMLGELKQSHFAVIPPDAYVAEEDSRAQGGSGVTGITVQLVGGSATITRVEAGSSAEEAGIRPGFTVTRIDKTATAPVLERIRKRRLRVPEEQIQVLVFGLSRLHGAVGSKVTVECVDGSGAKREYVLERREPEGDAVRFGEMPPMHTQVETRRLDGGWGYIRFNLFMMPVLDPIRAAVRSMLNAPGIIIDLRGNFGGIGAMAASIATEFSRKRSTLGAMHMRTGEIRFVVFERPTAYDGPLAILVDEASLSTSEILAGSLQENGRAVIIGRQTGGMVLPSNFEKLPDGARLQFVVADFRTPRGVLLEGRGVRPDVVAPMAPRELLAGRDPVLDAAVRTLSRRAGVAGTEGAK